MNRLYSLLFRKKVENVKLNNFYINESGRLIKIIRLDNYSGIKYFVDDLDYYWHDNGIKSDRMSNYIPLIDFKAIYGLLFGSLSNSCLYELNEQDKNKYWPLVVKHGMD